MTLLELCIGIVTAAFVGIGAYVVFDFAWGQTRHSEQSYFAETSQASASYQLAFDVNNSTPSYNLIVEPDGQNMNFFDYEPKAICEPTQAEPCTREILLESHQGYQSRPFYMFSSDDRAGPPMGFNPVLFYNVGTPSSVGQSASITYSAAKLAHVLQSPPYTEDCQTGQSCAKMWTTGQILYMYSPVYSAGNVEIPHPLSIVGAVGSNFYRVDFESSSGVDIIDTDPMSSTPVHVGTLDDFFRKLPPVGGATPLAFVRALKAVKYYIQPVEYQGKSTYRLMRAQGKVQSGGCGAPGGCITFPSVGAQVIAVPVRKVRLFRENISAPSIRVEIERDPAFTQ